MCQGSCRLWTSLSSILQFLATSIGIRAGLPGQWQLVVVKEVKVIVMIIGGSVSVISQRSRRGAVAGHGAMNQQFGGRFKD